MQSMQVRILVRELRPHMLFGKKKKKKNIKQKQYCNKFNKDFKNGPYKKNLYKEDRQRGGTKEGKDEQGGGGEKGILLSIVPSILPILSHFTNVE